MKNLKTVQVTKMEMEIITHVVDADHSSDGYGLAGYIFNDDFDMKKYRGVIASLIKKGIINTSNDDINGEPVMWVTITKEHQVENPKNDWSG